MRKHLTILVSVSSVTLLAQVVNGDFEDGLNGWIVPACQDAVIQQQFIADAGPHCLGLGSMVEWDCLMSMPVHQFQPWLTPGAWVLSGWMSGAMEGNISGAYVQLSTTSGYGTPLAQLICFGRQWIFQEVGFVINADVPIDSLRLQLFQDGSAMPYTYFDELAIVPDVSSSLPECSAPPIAFRPNPTTDKLWVDLPSSPISITVIDAIGRIIPLRTFHHNGHTLEVDVSSVPRGPCVLRMNTGNGIRTVRFIKT